MFQNNFLPHITITHYAVLQHNRNINSIKQSNKKIDLIDITIFTRAIMDGYYNVNGAQLLRAVRYPPGRLPVEVPT